MTQSKLGQREFVSLMALIMSLVALAIDAMLPALQFIGKDLGLSNINDTQYIISSIFAGMALGLIFFGPFSDSFGRKPAILSGGAIYIIGCLISYFSGDFQWMLIGRFLQGLGGASARVITIAMIRDEYSGNKMAKIMSLIMIIFIIVPAFAPSLGLLVMKFSHWRSIFSVMASIAFVAMLWFYLRQPESLSKEKRAPFRLNRILSGVKETITHRQSLPYLLSAGFSFGAFVGYLSLAQQIFQMKYKLGDQFAIAFGGLALCIGSASFMNSRLVERFGMLALCKYALRVLFVLSSLGLLANSLIPGGLSLVMFLIYMALSFFCVGILFGNFNALALQPLGHIAGVANSVISAVQTGVSVIVGTLIGSFYDGDVLPLVFGYLCCSFISILLVEWGSRRKVLESQA
ncbi:MAG: multidrug effflux MFS transporter [Bdellovibrionota bacterium]|tara:strand:- start:9605 stop:10816 length:1212 start_codon:yes stop_codon:yes gene_type:complete